MVQTLNFINLSSQQAPNDVNWAGLVNSGVQGVLIRLGHGIIRDPCASGHIAKAKQYGLYWHGYHTYEGVVNEPQFTIKNATELGLSTSQYYFADLTNSSDPFNDYYALHANWLSEGYSTGLLISNEDYLSKFTDSEVTASGSLRWLISDTEPANYDIWQYSSEGTIGTSSVKIGFNFAKTDKLKYNLSTTLTGADINKDPYNPQAPVGGAYIGWGYDTTGLGGGKTFGYSTNGKNFYALVGPKGLVVRKSDGNRIYGTIADQIDSAISANVIPAKSAADSAVAYANDAIEKSKVNSQAIDDINSAVSDAKQGANDAMSRAVSAWDAAQSNVDLIDSNYASASASISSARTEALAAADEAKKSASAAQADIVVVKSSVAAVQAGVATTRSDVAVAKSDIADTKAGLTIQAKSLSSYAAQASAAYNSTASALSDAKTAFSSDVAETKKLANTAQATADSAVESASENAKELASQANALSDAKKAMDSDVASAKELANAAQATADSAVESASSVANNLAAVASQANANANGITKVTSDVGLLQTTVADNTGDISTIQETAKQIQQAVSDNSGNITVAKQTADSAVAVASDAKSNATVAVQTASGASLTATNAQGDATTAMTTANSAVIQASDAKSNATVAVQTASEASLTAANAKGDASIAKQTASDASVQIKNAQGDIAQLKTRADGFDAEFATANGNISKLQTDATGTTQTLANTKSDVAVLQSRADGLDAKYADAAGDINTLKTNASGFSQTLTNAQGDISTLKSTVSGVQTTLTNAQGNISTLQSDVSGLKKTTSDNAGNISTLQSTANTLTSQMSSAQGDISTLKQTASGISSQVSGMSGDLNNLKSQAQWVIVTDTVDLNNIKTPCHEFLKGGVTNAPNETAWWYLTVEGSEDDRITQTVIADQSNNRYTRRFADSWSAWVRDATQTDVTSLSNLITANTTAINQNKNAITLKADQTAVDKINGTVSQLQSSLTVQAEQIQEKVTSSQVTGMLSGYATQDYTQSLVTQKADEWNANLTKLKNDTQTSLTQLAVGVEGVQAQVYNSDGSSKITQLSNLIATKVSQDDYNSQITQLKNDINLRVAKGDVISQINQEAGGDTLIQVSNGKKSLILDAGNTIITGKAWIPDAAISSISADKIMLGSSALYNSDGTLNLVNQSNDLKALIQVKQGLVQDTTQSIISFSSDYNNRAFSVTPVGATVTPTLFFERYDQTAGHWLGFTRNEVRRDGLMFNTWDNDGERFFVACHARFDRNISATGNIYQGSWNGTTGKPLAGVLSIQSGNTIWSGSDFLAIGDHLSNSFTNVMARSFSQQSTLSSKTNIETVDPKDALDLVNRTDIRSYQYKTDVAEGKAKRYTSLIIDDVNDVSKYYAPDEFTNEERTGRDDGSAVGYLFLAIQELTRRIKTLEEKLNG
ncbi:hypothetical protein HC007_00365 [Limosilactobacillus fermentum]